MFGQTEWTFTGISGTKYQFTLLSKSEELPRAAGVYILAYTHPRGHAAGWQVTPLFAGHADDMRSALDADTALDESQRPLWNCNFVLLESDTPAREECLRDLNRHSQKHP